MNPTPTLVDWGTSIVGVVALSAALWWQFVQPDVVPPKIVRIAGLFGAGMILLSATYLSTTIVEPVQLIGAGIILVAEFAAIGMVWHYYDLRSPAAVVKETVSRWTQWH